MPSRTRPRSWKPQAVAGGEVSLRIASSRVNASRSRTQCPRKCVGIELSMSWVTCAPESENVGMQRGCCMISSTTSWSPLRIGWRKNWSRSVSSARSIMHSTGSTPRSAATSATVRYGGVGWSMTRIQS